MIFSLNGPLGRFWPYITGLVVSLLLIVILSLPIAIIFNQTTLLDEWLNICQIIIAAVSLAIGGWFCARMAGNRGLFRGAMTGFLFLLFSLLWAKIGGVDSTFSVILIKGVFYVFFGALGGVLAPYREQTDSRILR